MTIGPKLTKGQVEEVTGELVGNGVPVRFFWEGAPISLLTGIRDQKGLNIIHQTAYWGFSRVTSRKIAKWLGVRAQFDKE